MACCNANNNTTNNQPTTKGNYIREAVARIDQLQKEATMQNLCEGCDGGLMAQIYNTKPVTFYLCGGTTFTVTIPNTTTTTSVFRIEDVRNDAAVLRLIDTTAEAEDFQTIISEVAENKETVEKYKENGHIAHYCCEKRAKLRPLNNIKLVNKKPT